VKPLHLDNAVMNSLIRNQDSPPPPPSTDASLGASPLHVTPAELESWIVEEDDDFIVFNKPGNIVCHPSKDGPWSSVAGAVKECRGMETAHLVSRLDRETSGVLIVAKKREAARVSQMAMQHRRVTKTYLAVLRGELPAPVLVDEPMGRDADSPVAVKHKVSRDPSAKTAVTFFEPLCAAGGYTLAQVTPHTGRTHQIRVHARWLGAPVVADKLYGPDELLYLDFVEHGWTPRQSAVLELPRHMLHAFRLEFKDPALQRVFQAPFAADLREFCAGKGLPVPAEFL
jgi:23S rRNA pseudouridine1911/1915/1917 synthase